MNGESTAVRNMAMLEDLSLGGMGLRVRVPLAVGSSVEISLRSQKLRGTVRHCARNGIGYFIGIQFQEGAANGTKVETTIVETSKPGSNHQRRTTVRKPHFSRVEISLPGEDKRVNRHVAMMEDASPAGVGLRVQAALPVGSPIEISLRGQRLCGTVRHCTRDGIGYFVGVQLRPVEDEVIKMRA